MTIRWSRPTWKLFHVLTANLIEKSFDEKTKNECINLFTKICNAIPCIFCRVHASEHMKTIIRDEIKAARDLELFFWKFHNKVNECTKKVLFSQENLITYKKNSVRKITNEFKNVLKLYYRNEKLSNEFNIWMKINENKFIYCNEIKKETKANNVKKNTRDAKVRKDARDAKVRKDATDAKDAKVRKDAANT